eukprot:765527-Ditylum_brightwellii.AAC.1
MWFSLHEIFPIKAEGQLRKAAPYQEVDDVDDDTGDGLQQKRKLFALLESMGSRSATNRVDLIASTIVVLEHLRLLNRKRRDEVVELKKNLEETQTALHKVSKKDMSGDALKLQEEDHLQGGCPYPLSYMPQPQSCNGGRCY